MKFKKAEMGMGTLILFIAMILVAAVAASVLVSTTGTLQNKALSTGKATAAEVGTSLNVVKMYAEDGSNQDLEEFVLLLKLNAGSDSIRFSDLLVTMNLDNQSSEYDYNSSSTCAASSTTTSEFAAEYLITGPNNKTDYLTKGDVVKICMQSPRNVSESESVKITLIPKVGSTRVLDVELPDLILNTRVDVFP